MNPKIAAAITLTILSVLSFYGVIGVAVLSGYNLISPPTLEIVEQLSLAGILIAASGSITIWWIHDRRS